MYQVLVTVLLLVILKQVQTAGISGRGVKECAWKWGDACADWHYGDILCCDVGIHSNAYLFCDFKTGKLDADFCEYGPCEELPGTAGRCPTY